MTLQRILESRKLTYYTSLICVALLSLYIHWLPPFMIALVVFWFAENKKGFNFRESLISKPGRLFLLFLVLFIWQAVEVLFADSYGAGAERIIKRASFLIFPLALFYPGSVIVMNVRTILKVFAISTLIYIFYCFGNAIDNSIIVKEGITVFYPHPELYTYENFFYGNHFSDIVHPTYLSMFVITSLLISLESVFDISLAGAKRISWFFCSLLFVIVIYLLSSRAGMLAAIVVLPLYFLIKLYSRVTKYLIYILIVVLVVGSVLLIKTNSRIQYSLEEVKSENINKTLDSNVRFVIWKSAFGVISRNLLLGVGTGDASAELKEEFLNRGYKDGYYDNMNSHNQFLEILLENGLIGLIIFLFIIGYIAYISISNQNLILGLFLLMMLVFFMFETLLNRLAGITFFPLLTFLLVHYRSETDKKGLLKTT